MLHSLKQSTAHLDVVYEIYPAEAHVLPLPTGVGTCVDDGCHTAHDASVLTGQKESCLAEAESRITTGIERLECVLEQVGNSLRTILVQLIVETDKRPQLLA